MNCVCVFFLFDGLSGSGLKERGKESNGEERRGKKREEEGKGRGN